MARKGVEVERVQQRIDEDLLTDLEQYPSQIRRWFIDNVFRRCLSYLVGFTRQHVARTVRVTESGLLRTETNQLKNVILLETLEDVERVFPYDSHYFFETTCSKEEISQPYVGQEKIVGIDLEPNQEIRIAPYINVPGTDWVGWYLFRVYATGTAKIQFPCGFPIGDASPTDAFCVHNEWGLVQRGSTEAKEFILNGGPSGGKIYFASVRLHTIDDLEMFNGIITPGRTITNADGTIAYYVAVPVRNDCVHRITFAIAGDGTNAIDYTVKLKNRFGGYTVLASGSVASSSLTWVRVYFPLVIDLNFAPNVPYVTIMLEFSTTSSAGALIKYIASTSFHIGSIRYAKSQRVSASASESSTILTEHDLIADDGVVKELKSISIDVSIASGGGQAQILIDNNVALDVTSSGTYDLPDLDNLVKVTAKLKGDGTNATTVTLNAIKRTLGYSGVR